MTSILDRPPGLHRNVQESEYHSRIKGMVSKGALDMIRRSPAHYLAYIEGTLPDEETPAMTFGRALHCALLEPDRFANGYAVQPDLGDCRYKAAKDAREAWLTAHAGRIALSADDGARIDGMRKSVRAHPIARRLLQGETEITARWADAETGLQCRARGDCYVPRFATLADVKTTDDASYEAFRRTVAKYGYHRIEALYRDGFAAAGAPIDHYAFVAIEKSAPYLVAVYSIAPADVAKGRATVREDIDTMARCLREDRWPGYPANIRTIDLPPWAA